MKTTHIQTKAQLEALQTKAHAFAKTLNKETLVIDQGERHIQIKANHLYQITVNGIPDQAVDLIAKKVGDDLEVSLEDSIVTFDDYFLMCKADSPCLVSLPQQDGGFFYVLADATLALETDVQIVYSYNKQPIVANEFTVINDSKPQESFNFGNNGLMIGLGLAVAAAGGGGGGGNKGGDDNKNDDDNTNTNSLNDIATDNIINASEKNTIITGKMQAHSTVTLSIDGHSKGVTVSGTSWAYTLTEADITAMGQGSKDITVTIKNANNTINTLTKTITINTITPTLNTIVIADTALKVNTTTLVTFTFSEKVTNFSNKDIGIPNGALTEVTSADNGKTWTATFTPNTNINADTNVFVVADTFTDMAGNSGIGKTSANFIIDTVINIIVADNNTQLDIVAGDALVEDSTAQGAIVLRFSASDEDATESPVVGFTSGSNAQNYYAISGLTVVLTVAGKTALDAGTVMPEISLTTTGTAVAVTKTLTPVTRATDDATVLTLTAGDALVEDSTVVGAVVGSFVVSDEDVGESPRVGFTANTNVNGYYAISGLTVILTATGKTALDIGTVMPQISLTTTGTVVAVTKTLTPTTRATDDATVLTLTAGDALVEDSTAQGVIVLRFSASDEDGGESPVVGFTSGSNAQNYYAISGLTVILTATGKTALDAGVVMPEISLTTTGTAVAVTKTLTPTTRATDDATVLTLTAGDALVEDSTAQGVIVLRFSASDEDGGESPVVGFTSGSNTQNYYAISGLTVILTATGKTALDIGTVMPQISLTTTGTAVAVTKTFIPTTTATEDATVLTLTAGNTLIEGSTVQGTAQGAIVLRFSVSDEDAAESPVVGFTSGSNAQNYYAINDLTVILTVAGKMALDAGIFMPEISLTTTGTAVAVTQTFTPTTTVTEDATVLTLTATNALIEGSTAQGAIVLRFNASDEDEGESPVVGFTSGSNAQNYYAISGLTVILTVAGKTALDAGAVMPEISLTTTGTAVAVTKTLTPVTRATDDVTVLTLTAGNALVEDSTVVGAVVGSFVVSDEDVGDTPRVDFTANTNINGYYAISGLTVILTATGKTALDAGTVMPEISLTTTGTAVAVTQTFTPTTIATEDATVLTLTAGNALVEDSTVVGTMVVSFVVSDEDVGESPRVGFTANTNINGYYAISGLTVILTIAGKTALDAGTVMPEISLTTTGTAVAVTQTFTPTTTATDDAPVVGSPALVIVEGGTVTLSATQLGVSDVDSKEDAVRIQVSGVVHGYFFYTDSVNTAITEFTLADVMANKVHFIHDGGEVAPAFLVAAKDVNTNYQTPIAAGITFTPVNDKGAIANILGVVKQGNTLSSGDITDVDGYNNDATYQWQMADTAAGVYSDIEGATGASFVLTQAQVGKFIKVVVSYTDQGGTNEVLTSAATNVVVLFSDTTPPEGVDLDSDTLDIQPTHSITANKAELAMGVVFDAKIATPKADDIAKIKLVFAHQQAGDKLILGNTVIDSHSNYSLTTLDGLDNNFLGAYKYTYNNGELIISKGDNGVIEKTSVKKIVEALQLKNTIANGTADITRTAAFAYIDSNGNEGDSATVSLSLNTSAPSVSSAKVDFGNNESAKTIVLTLSEAVTGMPDIYDFTVKFFGTINILRPTSRLVTEVVVQGNIVTLTVEENVFYVDQHITVAYTQNTNTSKRLVDVSGNTLDTFSRINIDVIETTLPTHKILTATGNQIYRGLDGPIATSTDLFLKFDSSIKLGTDNIDDTSKIIIYEKVDNGNDVVFEAIKVGSGLVSVVDISTTDIYPARLKINPIKDFEVNKTYYVHIGSQVVSDFRGNYFTGINDDSWHFSTLGVSTSAVWSDEQGNDVATDGVINEVEAENLFIKGVITTDAGTNMSDVSIEKIKFQCTRGWKRSWDDIYSHTVNNPNVQINTDGTWTLDKTQVPTGFVTSEYFNIAVTLRVTNPDTGEVTDTVSVNNCDVYVSRSFPMPIVITTVSGEDAIVNQTEGGANLRVAFTYQTKIHSINRDYTIQLVKKDASGSDSLLGNPYTVGFDTYIDDMKGAAIFVAKGDLVEGDNRIAAIVTDAVGSTVNQSEIFTLIVDTIAPNLTKTSVPTTADLNLTFNEAVKLGTGTITIYQEKSQSKDDKITTIHLIDGNINQGGNVIHFNTDKTQLMISLAHDLDLNSDYYATVSTGAIVDTAGNAYAGIALGNSTSDWAFTTPAHHTPRITSWAVNPPENGHTGFGVGDEIRLTLNATKALKFTADAVNSNITIAGKIFQLDTHQGAGAADATPEEQKQAVFTYTVLLGDSVNSNAFQLEIDAVSLVGITDVNDNTLINRPGAYPVTGLIADNHHIDGILPTIINSKVDTNANTLTFTFDEALHPSTHLAIGDFKAKVGRGTEQSLSGNITLSTNTLTLALDNAFATNDITRLTYAESGGKITDTAGNTIKTSLYYGTDADDAITGSDQDNIFISSKGNDTFTSGAGKDTFQYNTTMDGNDKIQNFVIGSAGDVLNLSNLLTGYDFIGTLSEFVTVVTPRYNKAIITVDANGLLDNAGVSNLEITLYGDFRIGYEVYATLQDLVDKGNLVPSYTVPSVVNADRVATDNTVTKITYVIGRSYTAPAKTKFIISFNKDLDTQSVVHTRDFVITKTTLGEADSVLNIAKIYVDTKSIELKTDFPYSSNEDTSKDSVIHITYHADGLKNKFGYAIENMSIYWGNDSANTITGNNKNDSINGNAGNDTLIGGKGDDVLLGGLGNDILTGGEGDDVLYGASGNDILTGGEGNDSLYGGSGNDILTGGKGSDVFICRDRDVITDFNLGLVSGSDKDILKLSSFLDDLTELSQHVSTSLSSDGKDTLITVNSDDDHAVTTLKGVVTTLEELAHNGNIIL